MSINARRHPLDYDALRKGDVIDEAQLIAALRVTPEHDHWRLRALQECDNIKRKRGLLAKFIESERKIRVLTDLEASDWNHHKYEIAMRSMGQRERDDRLIGRDGMTRTQSDRQDQRQLAKAIVNQTIRQEVRKQNRLLAAFTRRRIDGGEHEAGHGGTARKATE